MPNNVHVPKYFIDQLVGKHRYYSRLCDIEKGYNSNYQEQSEIVKSTMKKWHILRRAKSIRSIFMFLQKHKYATFTYSAMILWRTTSKLKVRLIGELQSVLNKNTFNESDTKYMLMCINTLNKYDDHIGRFVACAVHRVFYYDVARLILEYI